MPARRRTGLWVTGIVGLAAAAGVTTLLLPPSTRKIAPPAAGSATAAATPATVRGLVPGLRDSDARALAALLQKATPAEGKAPAALTDDEAAEWVEAVQALRTGFLRFGSYGRASALAVTGRVIQRFAIEPAPTSWVDVIGPAHDLLSSGLNDQDLDVRVSALAEVGRLWGWTPGRTLTHAEEDSLAAWKEGFATPVVRRLGDREAKARIAAVACLGTLPIDRIAAPAVAYVDDPSSPEVRKQVLASFAGRSTLLTNEAVLRHMFDREAGIPEVAELVLQTRGLNREQISLGGMIFHPKADIRASVIPMIKDRTDIDPAVWLLQLSRDTDETVRLGAVEALAARLTPEGGQRLAEMAATDKSPAVRKAASKHLPEIEKTAALPPLPGSPSLNPKAN